MTIIDTLFPIFGIIALGIALRKSAFTTAAFFKETNRLVYWIGLPALLLVKISQPNDDPAGALRVSAVIFIGLVVCALVGYLTCWLLKVPKRSVGAFVQAAFRGNLAYVGLPVILYSMPANDPTVAAIEAMAVLAFAPIVPIYNMLAVFVLVSGRDELEGQLATRLKKVAIGVLTNPLVIACVLGVLISQTGIIMPRMLQRGLLALGQMSLPLALLSIGATLTFSSLKGSSITAIVSATIKVAIGPLVGVLAARQLGLNPAELRVALLFLACPTAVTSYVMADQLGADAELSAGIVLLSTVGAIPALAAVLLMT